MKSYYWQRKAIVLSFIIAILLSSGKVESAYAVKSSIKSGKKRTGQKVCAEDSHRLCPGLRMSSGLGNCLKAHMQDIENPMCKERFEALTLKVERRIASKREKSPVFKKACKKEIQLHCASTKPGDGQQLACLRGKVNFLSMECRQQIN